MYCSRTWETFEVIVTSLVPASSTKFERRGHGTNEIVTREERGSGELECDTQADLTSSRRV